MLQRSLLAVGAGALIGLAGCERAPVAGDGPAAAAEDREPLRHQGSIHDPRPMESVTGVLRFEGGCWTVSSGPNRIALFFPKETKLSNGGLHIGSRRLREGEAYKFVGDLAETEVDKLPTCGGLPSSMAVGDAWPPTGERATE
jgi:hypothetical protein